MKGVESVSPSSSLIFEKEDEWKMVKSRNKIRQEKTRDNRSERVTGSKRSREDHIK